MNRNDNPESGKKTAVEKIFVPRTISESIKISEDNMEKIALIDTQESPSLESDLTYILKTSIRHPLQNMINDFKHFFRYNEVKTEYYLTYHQKREDAVIKKTKAKKKNKKYIGDEILQIINFSHGTANRRLLLFISDFEVGGTRYSKDFLQKEGYIPIERFIGGKYPRWIIISAGPAASIQVNNAGELKEKYLIVPGKINFKFSERMGLVEYKYKLISSTEFLYNNIKIRKMARDFNVETAIITAEKILILERIDNSWKDNWKNFFLSITRYKDIRYTLSGCFISSLGSGILQGAVINPILNMMEQFSILVLLMWIMQYIYPNIVYTFSVILSANRFDKLKSAEKDTIVQKATIYIETKKVLLKVAVAGILSNFLLLTIYPDFLLSAFMHTSFIEFLVVLIYIGSSIMRDWPVTFEQDALFRILKRSLSTDAELSNNLLVVNAFTYSSNIVISLAGLIIGWIAMSINPLPGIILAITGVILSFAKLLYPYYGNDFQLALLTNAEPFFASEFEMVLIPHKVVIRSKNMLRLHKHRQYSAIYDNYDFEILLEDSKCEPLIIEKQHHRLANKTTTWILSWTHKQYKQKIILISKNSAKPWQLVRLHNDANVLYALSNDTMGG